MVTVLIHPVTIYGAGSTTETGGWLLVLNYVHQGGTNPDLGFRSGSLPILNSSCDSAADPGSMRRSVRAR